MRKRYKEVLFCILFFSMLLYVNYKFDLIHYFDYFIYKEKLEKIFCKENNRIKKSNRGFYYKGEKVIVIGNKYYMIDKDSVLKRSDFPNIQKSYLEEHGYYISYEDYVYNNDELRIDEIIGYLDYRERIAKMIAERKKTITTLTDLKTTITE